MQCQDVDTSFSFAVAPAIIVPGTSPQSSAYVSNSDEILSVYYMSKDRDDTRIYWYKDDNLIQGMGDTTDPMNSWTEVNFQPIRRSDAGNYRVVIENTHSFIQSSMRLIEISLTVDVTIPPARPMWLNFNHISRMLTWTYHNITTDDSAQEQTVFVHYRNTILQTVLNGDVRQMKLAGLIPGESYAAQVAARNQDGLNTSHKIDFITLPGGESLCRVSSKGVRGQRNRPRCSTSPLSPNVSASPKLK